MIQYPLKFEVRSEAPAGQNSAWQGHAPAQESPIHLAIPPEFGGPGSGYSPEDIYALALQNCFIATFKVFAEKSRLEFTKIESQGILTVDRNQEGKPWMAKIDFVISLHGAKQKDSALRMLEKVSRSCMILDSVKTEKTFQFNVLE